jgi:hypothetical protein
VLFERVFLAPDAGNTALSPRRVGFCGFFFRDDCDGPVLCGSQCKTEAGDATTYDDEVVFFQKLPDSWFSENRFGEA